RAVTLGLATIIAAREVVVLVSGEAKREPLARALDGPVTPEVPASILRTHPRCLVIADRAARPRRAVPPGRAIHRHPPSPMATHRRLWMTVDDRAGSLHYGDATRPGRLR